VNIDQLLGDYGEVYVVDALGQLNLFDLQAAALVALLLELAIGKMRLARGLCWAFIAGVLFSASAAETEARTVAVFTVGVPAVLLFVGRALARTLDFWTEWNERRAARLAADAAARRIEGELTP
jgi:hypothetical protein